MPANEVTANINTEELRPPASVLRTLAFVRSRGARSSAPDADGTARPTGIGSRGLAAEALAQSLTARTLSPLTLGSPDWLTALLRRHRFATWSLGLPNLYYFHWLRAAEEAAEGSAPATSMPSVRPYTGRLSASGPSLPGLASGAALAAPAGRPSWAMSSPVAFPTPEFVLARSRRASAPDEDVPSVRYTAPTPRLEDPRSVPLLSNTLNATTVLPPVLTLHTATAQGRPAAWTDSSLMQFADPEAMAASVARRTATPSRPSISAPERAADSPYMPVSYPPVPLASWLGVAASAPEKSTWESVPGFLRSEFSPAAAHLLVLPKLAAVRTQPDFDSPAETAFASLPRLSSARTSAQAAGATSSAVQAAQSAAIQPTRPSWPPSPMPPTIGMPVAPAPVTTERQPREPSTAGAEEPAAARRSPLAAARTALEVVQRFGTQAAQTLRLRGLRPPLAPSFALPETGRATYTVTLPSLRSLPRLRRTPEVDGSAPVPSANQFYGVPSVLPFTQRATEPAGASHIPTRYNLIVSPLVEPMIAQGHQPLTASVRRQPVSSIGPVFEDASTEGIGSWGLLPTAFSGLPLPLVSRARLAEHDFETQRNQQPEDRTPQAVSPTTPVRISPPTVEAPGFPALKSAQTPNITGSVLTRTTALIASVVARVAGVSPSMDPVEARGDGTPFAAARAFLGQFLLPRRRDALPLDAQEPVSARPITAMPAGVLSAFPASPGAVSVPPGPAAFLGIPHSVAGLPLARRPRVTPAPDSLLDAPPTPFTGPYQRIVSGPQAGPATVDFSAGVTTRYMEAARAGATGQPTVTAPRILSPLVGRPAASGLPILSSLAAPLLRFLRLGSLRPADSEAVGDALTGDRRLESPIGMTPGRMVTSGAVSAEQTGAVIPRVLSPGTDALASLTLPMRASIAGPLLRFLRLENLHPNDPDGADAAQATGSVSPSLTTTPPIWGGIPTPLVATAVVPRPTENRQPDAAASVLHRFATPWATLQLPSLTRRISFETMGESADFGNRSFGNVPPARQSGQPRFAQESTADLMPDAATPMQRFLSRWTQATAPQMFNQVSNGTGRLFLPKRSPATRQTDVTTGRGVFPDSGIVHPQVEGQPGRRAILSGARTFADRRMDSSSYTGESAVSEPGTEDLTGAFQTQMLAPIREFLLSTLSRILSPLEGLRETAQGRQAPAEETSRNFRRDTVPEMVWWSPPAETSPEEVSQVLPGWAGPSLPLLGIPTLAPFTATDRDGLGKQRRLAQENPRQTEFARSGLQALRAAAERMSRAVAGPVAQQAFAAADAPPQASTVTRVVGSQAGRRLPMRPFGRETMSAAPRADRSNFGLLSPEEADTGELLRDALALRPLRLPLPSAGTLLPREGTEEGPVRDAERRLTQASLTARTMAPLPTESRQEPAWMSGRTGSALAERVPSMPLPLRGDRSEAGIAAAMRDPYVIQRVAEGTAVAAPAPRSTSASAHTTDGEHEPEQQSDVNAMASEVWTILRRKMALEAARSGHR